MNIHIFLKCKTPEEIVITLRDNNKKVIMRANKQILYDRLIYFKNISSFKESTLQHFEIEVPNAHIVHDIILSCRNPKWNINDLPEWNIGNLSRNYYILEYWKCCDFLCLPFCNELLYNIEHLSIENYDLLVDTMELLGYDKYKIWLMNKLLPPNYDLSKFPKELIKNMIKCARSYIFIEGTEIWNCNNLWNFGFPKKSCGFKLCDIQENEQVLSVSRDIKRIATIIEKTLMVRNLKSGKILYVIEECSGIKCVDFTDNSDILVIVNISHIRILSILNKKYIRNLCYLDEISTFTCSPNGKYFAVVTNNKSYENIRSIPIYNSLKPRHLEIYESISQKLIFAFMVESSYETLVLSKPFHPHFFSEDSNKVILNIHLENIKCTEIKIKNIFENTLSNDVLFFDDRVGMAWDTNCIHYMISDFEWMFVVDETIHIFDIKKLSTTIKFKIPQEKPNNIPIQILQHVHKYIIVILRYGYNSKNRYEMWNVAKGKLLYGSDKLFQMIRKNDFDLIMHLEKFK